MRGLVRLPRDDVARDENETEIDEGTVGYVEEKLGGKEVGEEDEDGREAKAKDKVLLAADEGFGGEELPADGGRIDVGYVGADDREKDEGREGDFKGQVAGKEGLGVDLEAVGDDGAEIEADEAEGEANELDEGQGFDGGGPGTAVTEKGGQVGRDAEVCGEDEGQARERGEVGVRGGGVGNEEEDEEKDEDEKRKCKGGEFAKKDHAAHAEERADDAEEYADLGELIDGGVLLDGEEEVDGAAGCGCLHEKPGKG